MYGLPSIEEQLAQCRQWADWVRAAGYDCGRHWKSDDPADPFGNEWQIWTPERDWWLGPLATFDIDGTGASWHGPDELFMKLIGPHVEMVSDEEWAAAHVKI